MRPLGARQLRRSKLPQHLDLRVIDGVGKIIAFHVPHVGFAFFVVKAFDVILAGFVQINRLLVERRESRGKRNLRDHHGLSGDVHHYEIVAGYRTQANGVRRVAIRCPMPRSSGMVQESGFLQKAAQVGGLVWSEFFSIRQRQLERRAFHVGQQDFEIVGVDTGMLRRLAEEVLRVFNDVLVERRARCHQYGRGRALPPSGPAGALPR